MKEGQGKAPKKREPSEKGEEKGEGEPKRDAEHSIDIVP